MSGRRFLQTAAGVIAALALAMSSSALQRPSLPGDADQPVRTQTKNPDAVAVVIGIQDYQSSDVPKVDFAINDAEAVQRVLTSTLGYDPARILLRKNGEASIGRLKRLIKQQLKDLVVPAKSDVFVYYSGHGAPNAKSKEPYLVPWDFDLSEPTPDTAYRLKDFYDDLATLGAKSVTVILESCFSGVSDGGAVVKDASPLNIVVDDPAQTLTGRANGVVITASGSQEYATWYRDRKHGLMTYYWLRGLQGEAGDANGRVTPASLKQYLQANVTPIARQLKQRSQTPNVLVSSQPDRVLAQLPISALRTNKAVLVETFGSLEISIDIGGDLAIDGVPQGTIPAGRAFRQAQIAAGSHDIEIRKDGYAPIREQIVILPDQTARKAYLLNANLPTVGRLDRVYGLIQVSVDRGGVLFIDDKRETDLPPFAPYTTPRIEAGPHKVRVEKPGFLTINQEIMVRPNDTARLDLTLKAVTSAPPANPPTPVPTDRPVSTSTRDALTGMEFVSIQPGEFMMGCSPGDYRCDTDEKPVHLVKITKGFEIGKYEVTQAQWESVMGSNPSSFKGADRPVENISWNDAQTFLQKLNNRNDGHHYRLSTEAEWEYAARAGNTEPYVGLLSAIAWYSDNSGKQTHPVGEKQPNAWGLYDMIGNVWEWVQDWYDVTYGFSASKAYENDSSGPASGDFRVLRGGSWLNDSTNLRVSNRSRVAPAGKNYSAGFRCVREPISTDGTLPGTLSTTTRSTKAAPPNSAPGQPPARIRQGGSVQQAMLLSQTSPIYPPLAKQAHIQGTVTLEAVIGRDGSVTEMRVISGHPLLQQAAIDAVSHWKYKPTVLNGEPVEVVTTVTVNFAFQ